MAKSWMDKTMVNAFQSTKKSGWLVFSVFVSKPIDSCYMLHVLAPLGIRHRSSMLIMHAHSHCVPDISCKNSIITNIYTIGLSQWLTDPIKHNIYLWYMCWCVEELWKSTTPRRLGGERCDNWGSQINQLGRARWWDDEGDRLPKQGRNFTRSREVGVTVTVARYEFQLKNVN